MTYEIYRYIFIIGAILAAIMLVLSIVLFIVLKIPKVIGDLTGSNARKAIKNIRTRNDRSDRKEERLTGEINSYNHNDATANGNTREGQAVHTENTTLLYDNYETTVLDNRESETTVLSNQGYGEETSVLSDFSDSFELVYEITYIHTDEIIY